MNDMRVKTEGAIPTDVNIRQAHKAVTAVVSQQQQQRRPDEDIIKKQQQEQQLQM